MGNETYLKRQKELARHRKKQDKAARKLQRKEEKAKDGTPEFGDPDIADIQPGPQPKSY